jgi:formylglycine-generating enzyme required for sulfatase activity
MGSPTNDLEGLVDETQHTVTLTKGFYFGKFLVTQADYLVVIGRNPSFFNGGAYGTDLSRPVEQVSWNDATNYCAQRTQQEAAAGLIPAGSQYRLPTEAEWEYACRAWTSTRLYYGEDPGYTEVASYAWYSDNSGGMTHPVGQLLPNLWGLYDMVGNVFQWCHDWYGAYPTGTVIDPQGPASGSGRVCRGCGWRFDANNCRSAGQRVSDAPPNFSAPGFGFRVVLAADQL